MSSLQAASDEDFEISELSDDDDDEDVELEEASADAPWCHETGGLFPLHSSTPARPTGSAAVAEAGAETVEQAARKRRRVATPANDSINTQPDSSQGVVGQDQQSQQNHAPTSKRARLSPAAQHTHGRQRTPPAAVTWADGAAAAAVGVAVANRGSMASPRRGQRKQRSPGQPNQQQQQKLMSPPPPRQARQQRPKPKQQSPDPQHKQQQQQLVSPHKHATRSAARAHAAASAAAGPCSPSFSGLSGLSGLAAASSITAASTAGDTAAGDDESEAICLRTRSKHPIAEQEFDPDMFDRLLAEFDPDLEPLLDEEMYQHFLQTLQDDPSYGTIVPDTGPDSAAAAAHAASTATQPPPAVATHAGSMPAVGSIPRPPNAPAAAAAAGAAATAAAVTQLLPLQPPPPLPLLPLGGFSVDDDDDEEFMLDPLDWLLDDEADVVEEEALLKFVEPAVEALSSAAVEKGGDVGTAASARGRRSQREAARRAAERIAAKQQQHWLLQQQQLQGQQAQGMLVQGFDAGAGSTLLQQQEPVQQAALLPLIPAVAAGDLQQLQHPAPLAGAAVQQHAGLAGGAGHAGGDSSFWGLPAMQHMQEGAAAEGAWGGSQAWPLGSSQQQEEGDQQDDGSAAAVLTIRAEQLQQLYQQISLHTQLLTQLYVVTVLDPSPSAQLMASAAGQMLEQIRRMHATSTDSVRGQQLGQLVQHAFQEAASACGAGDASPPFAVQRLRRVREPRLAVWQPPISDMQTIWDTSPLRQLDYAVQKLQLMQPPEVSIVQAMLDRVEQAAPRRGHKTGPERGAARAKKSKQLESYTSKLLHAVLGDAKLTYDSVAWPRMVLQPRKDWSPAEDSLLWLGVLRFTSALTPFTVVTTCISTELLPARPAQSIRKRFENLVIRKDATAELVLSFALIGDEGPAAWQSPAAEDSPAADASAQQLPRPAQPQGHRHSGSVCLAGSAAYRQDQEEDWDMPGDVDPNSGGSASLQRRPKSAKGAFWAAGELGAALTAAFAMEEYGSSLSGTAAAAAASALLGTGGAAAADPADSAAAAAAGTPAAPAAGKQLLHSVVTQAVDRLPMLLPCPVEVPTAASLRRRGWSAALSARQAGQQMLMALAARHILGADAPLDTPLSEAAADVPMTDATADPPLLFAAAAAADVRLSEAASDDPMSEHAAAATAAWDDPLLVPEHADAAAAQGGRGCALVSPPLSEAAAAATAAAGLGASSTGGLSGGLQGGVGHFPGLAGEVVATAAAASCSRQSAHAAAGSTRVTAPPGAPALATEAAAAAVAELEQPLTAAVSASMGAAAAAADDLDALIDHAVQQEVWQQQEQAGKSGCQSASPRKQQQLQQQQQQGGAAHPPGAQAGQLEASRSQQQTADEGRQQQEHEGQPRPAQQQLHDTQQQQVKQRQQDTQQQEAASTKKRWWQLPKDKQQQQQDTGQLHAVQPHQQPGAPCTKQAALAAAAAPAAAVSSGADADAASHGDDGSAGGQRQPAQPTDSPPAADHQQQQQQLARPGLSLSTAAQPARQTPAAVPGTKPPPQQHKPPAPANGLHKSPRKPLPANSLHPPPRKPAPATSIQQGPRKGPAPATGLQGLRARTLTSSQLAEQLRSTLRQQEEEERMKQQRARRQAMQQRKAARQQQRQEDEDTESDDWQVDSDNGAGAAQAADSGASDAEMPDAQNAAAGQDRLCGVQEGGMAGTAGAPQPCGGQGQSQSRSPTGTGDGSKPAGSGGASKPVAGIKRPRRKAAAAPQPAGGATAAAGSGSASFPAAVAFTGAAASGGSGGGVCTEGGAPPAAGSRPPAGHDAALSAAAGSAGTTKQRMLQQQSSAAAHSSSVASAKAVAAPAAAAAASDVAHQAAGPALAAPLLLGIEQQQQQQRKLQQELPGPGLQQQHVPLVVRRPRPATNIGAGLLPARSSPRPPAAATVASVQAFASPAQQLTSAAGASGPTAAPAAGGGGGGTCSGGSAGSDWVAGAPHMGCQAGVSSLTVGIAPAAAAFQRLAAGAAGAAQGPLRRKPLPAAAAAVKLGRGLQQSKRALQPRPITFRSAGGGASGSVSRDALPQLVGACGDSLPLGSSGGSTRQVVSVAARRVQGAAAPPESSALLQDAAAAGGRPADSNGIHLTHLQSRSVLRPPGSAKRLSVQAGVLANTPRTRPPGPLPGSVAAAAAAVVAAAMRASLQTTPKQLVASSAPSSMVGGRVGSALQLGQLPQARPGSGSLVQQQWQQQLLWQKLQLWHQRQQQPDPLVPPGGRALATAAAATPAVAPSGGWMAAELGSTEKKEKLRRSLFGKGPKPQQHQQELQPAFGAADAAGGVVDAAAAAGPGPKRQGSGLVSPVAWPAFGGSGGSAGRRVSVAAAAAVPGAAMAGPGDKTRQQQQQQGQRASMVSPAADENAGAVHGQERQQQVRGSSAEAAAKLLCAAQQQRKEQQQQQAAAAAHSHEQQQQGARGRSKLAAAVMALGMSRANGKHTPHHQEQEPVVLQRPQRSLRQQQAGRGGGGGEGHGEAHARRSSRQQAAAGGVGDGTDYPEGLDVLASAAAAEADGTY